MQLGWDKEAQLVYGEGHQENLKVNSAAPIPRHDLSAKGYAQKN